MTFAEALVRSGTNDKEAQAILERLIDNNDSNSDALASWIKAKIFISRVLRRRGKDKSAEKQYVVPQHPLGCALKSGLRPQ